MVVCKSVFSPFYHWPSQDSPSLNILKAILIVYIKCWCTDERNVKLSLCINRLKWWIVAKYWESFDFTKLFFYYFEQLMLQKIAAKFILLEEQIYIYSFCANIDCSVTLQWVITMRHVNFNSKRIMFFWNILFKKYCLVQILYSFGWR